jgi:hypothetical protein
MASCAWANSPNNQRSSSLLSAGFRVFDQNTTRSLARVPRERREHRVFNKLLQLIPALEDRLMEKSEEEITLMAELVTFRV